MHKKYLILIIIYFPRHIGGGTLEPELMPESEAGAADDMARQMECTSGADVL